MTTWRESTWRWPWLWRAIAFLMVFRVSQFWDWSWLIKRPELGVFVGILIALRSVARG